MININNISSIYFLGIGGIGMSALARYFNEKNIRVSGYDKTETALTKMLVAEGIAIHYVDDISCIDATADLVVYTPAIPATHTELQYYKQHNYRLLKRSDVLSMLTTDTLCIAIAGTHGKTTTSAMIAHILTHSGYGCTAFLGGIATNYNSNYWSTGHNKITVVEADEYDRSFLKLTPTMAVITSMDVDHLDIYGTEENMQEAFIQFAANIKVGGYLIVKYGLKQGSRFTATYTNTYDIANDKANIVAQNIMIKDGAYVFTIKGSQYTLPQVTLHMGGMHNIENVVAAIAVAKYLDIADEKIIAAVASFAGVKRRFEYILKPAEGSDEIANDKPILIDDYAHHPQELKALLEGAKNLYPHKKCIIIFQPHLYSRTIDLAAQFAAVLNLADQTWLLPIYPARELPIPGVTSAIIAAQMINERVELVTKEELMQQLLQIKLLPASQLSQTVIITAGAGDIDTMVQPIKTIFS